MDQTLDEQVEEREDREIPTQPTDTPVARRRLLPDVLALVSYVAMGYYVMARLWADPAGLMLRNNRDDHGLFLFLIGHGERVVFHGASPFFSDRLNAPGGVNMMANTSMLAVSIPMAPITHYFGVAVTVVLLLSLGLAGTAAAWYWVLSRHFVSSRTAAWIGGLWGGFAPAWISHASGHVNFVSGYVIPFLVWQVLRLREPGRVWRGGVILGLLVTLQTFINEEALLFAALTLGLFIPLYAVMRPRIVREAAPRFLAGGAVAAGVAGVLLAYPLYYQFRGPGNYHGQPFPPDRFTTTLLSMIAYPRQAVAGTTGIAKMLSGSATEDNTFWGPAGFVMIVVSAAMLWRSAAARAAALAGLGLLLVSFGSHLRFTKTETSIPTGLGWVSHVPILNLVTVPRYALASTVVAGVLLALAVDRAPALPRGRRNAYWIGLVLALAPLFPKPVPTLTAPTIPAFFAQGLWRGYVQGDQSVVMVPMPEVESGREGERVEALTRQEFRVARGYFMGPQDPPRKTRGAWGAPRRYTNALLTIARVKGVVTPITPRRRNLIIADLHYWRAAVVVLLPDAENGPALQALLTGALGPPRLVGGVELWDVRSL